MGNNKDVGPLRRIDDLELTKALWPFDATIMKPRPRTAKNTRKKSPQLFHIKPHHWTWQTWTITAVLRTQDGSHETSRPAWRAPDAQAFDDIALASGL